MVVGGGGGGGGGGWWWYSFFQNDVRLHSALSLSLLRFCLAVGISVVIQVGPGTLRSLFVLTAACRVSSVLISTQ